MEYEEFESELGAVAVTKDHVEREDRDSEEWEKIRENFTSDEIVDKAHFSRIEGIKFRPESIYPHILLKIDGGWKRMFFKAEEDAKDCFKLISYRWKSFKQIYE